MVALTSACRNDASGSSTDLASVPNVSVGDAQSFAVGQGQSDDAATAAAVHRDGSAVVVGIATHRAVRKLMEKDLAILRFRRGGKIDRSFGKNGRVVTSFRALHDEKAVAVDIDPQHRVVVAGRINMSAVNSGRDERDRILVARYRRDGSVDRSFAKGGKAIFQTPGDVEQGDTVGLRIRPSGQIVIAGNDGYGSYVLQLTSTGKRDPSFGKDGLARGPKSFSLYAYLFGLALDDAGLPVILGYFSPADSNRSCTLAKFDQTGNLEESFGRGGWFASDVSRNPRLAVCSAAVPVGHSMLAFGSATSQNDSQGGTVFRERPSTMKLGPMGVPDGDFGEDGIASASDPDPSRRGTLEHGASPLGIVLGASGASVGISTIDRNGRYVLTPFGPSGAVPSDSRISSLGPKAATTCAATSASGHILICGTRRGAPAGNDFSVAFGTLK